MWNFKGYLWNSTQNILPIHWKMWILLTYENLRALWFKSSYVFLKRPPGDINGSIIWVITETLPQSMLTKQMFEQPMPNYYLIAFENDMSNMSSMLCRPQCVNHMHSSLSYPLINRQSLAFYLNPFLDVRNWLLSIIKIFPFQFPLSLRALASTSLLQLWSFSASLLRVLVLSKIPWYSAVAAVWL